MPEFISYVNQDFLDTECKFIDVSFAADAFVGVASDYDTNLLSTDGTSLTKGIRMSRINPVISNKDIIDTMANAGISGKFISSTNPINVQIKEGRSFEFKPGPIKVAAYFRVEQAEVGAVVNREIDNYKVFYFDLNIISFTPTSATIEMPQVYLTSIDSWFRKNGFVRPQYGLIVIGSSYKAIATGEQVFSQGGVVEARPIEAGSPPTLLLPGENLSLFAFTFDPPYVVTRPSLAAAETPSISDFYNIYTTKARTFETLFIPTLTGSVVYNFYETTEQDYKKASSRNRNYSKKPLSQIPRFVMLKWTEAPQNQTDKSQEIHGAMPDSGIVTQPGRDETGKIDTGYLGSILKDKK